MARCMICGKEKDEAELSGRICRACSAAVRREAQAGKVAEKRDADRAVRGSGQSPPKGKDER